MLLQALHRLLQNQPCICYPTSDCAPQNTCGEKQRVSCTSISSSCSPTDLCGYDICGLSWIKVCSPLCESPYYSSQGYDKTSLSPTLLCADFLNNACVPSCFRGRPTYLKCQKCFCGKLYVVLGVSGVGDVAFELASQRTCDMDIIYQICRVSFICN